MNIYTLKRTDGLSDGTFGEIIDGEGNVLCYTCELPWVMNEPGKSCIPVGSYLCNPYSSPHHPDVWQITDVPGRSSILIHSGNTEADSLGCVILGLTRGTLNGVDAVLQSVDAIKKMRTIWKAPFRLDIKEDLA